MQQGGAASVSRFDSGPCHLPEHTGFLAGGDVPAFPLMSRAVAGEQIARPSFWVTYQYWGAV
jgi:hypothetical protein